MEAQTLIAIGTVAGVLGTMIVKYLIGHKTVSLTEQELLDKRRGDFHQEVVSQLQREVRAKDECHEREQELRLLLWQAIGKAEEATGEAESNAVHFRPEWER